MQFSCIFGCIPCCCSTHSTDFHLHNRTSPSFPLFSCAASRTFSAQCVGGILFLPLRDSWEVLWSRSFGGWRTQREKRKGESHYISRTPIMQGSVQTIVIGYSFTSPKFQVVNEPFYLYILPSVLAKRIQRSYLFSLSAQMQLSSTK